MNNIIDDYYDGLQEIIDDSGNPDIFKISPSSLEDFFSATSTFYHEQVLGNEKQFTQSTSTILGTIIHRILELSADNAVPSTIDSDIDAYLAAISDPAIDIATIRTLWKPMSKCLYDNTIGSDWVVDSTEQFIYEKLNDDVYIGGTPDIIISDGADGYIVVDYKTSNAKPASYPRRYKYQAYAYSWMLRNRGYNITAVRASYITRPTKTLPERYFEFTAPYTNETHEFIGDILNLIAESVSLFKHNPDLRHIISQDMRNKPVPVMPSFPH